jgi:transcriptional regulator with XRE-family HTH domain
VKPDRIMFARALAEVLVARRGTRTQKDMAALAGLDQSTLSRYERGLFLPDVWSLRCIALAAGTDLGGIYRQVDALLALYAKQAPLEEERAKILAMP